MLSIRQAYEVYTSLTRCTNGTDAIDFVKESNFDIIFFKYFSRDEIIQKLKKYNIVKIIQQQ